MLTILSALFSSSLSWLQPKHRLALEAIHAVLVQTGTLPLDSLPHYPLYNGVITNYRSAKVKRALPVGLPCPRSPGTWALCTPARGQTRTRRHFSVDTAGHSA